MTSSAYSKLWKQNRDVLENDVFILKHAFCRLSKRLCVLENFLASKFTGEFPRVISDNFVFATEILEVAVESEPARTSPSINNGGISGSHGDSKNPLDESKNRVKGGLVDPIDDEWDANVIFYDDDDDSQSPRTEAEDEIETQDQHQDMELNKPYEDIKDPDYLLDTDGDGNKKQPSKKKSRRKMTDDDIAKKGLLRKKYSRNKKGERKGPSGGESENIEAKRAKRKYFKSIIKDKNAPQQTCPICQRVFTTKYRIANLRLHLETHNLERKHKCKYCDKTFRLDRPRRTHELRVHHREQNLIYDCNYCEKKFITSEEKARHERVHTGEKPFSCEICVYKATTRTGLAKHRRKHGIAEPSKLCTTCGKTFKTDGTLRKHEENVHNSYKVGRS